MGCFERMCSSGLTLVYRIEMQARLLILMKNSQISPVSARLFGPAPALLFGILEPSCCKKRQKKIPTKKLVWGIEGVWRIWIIPNWSKNSTSDPLKGSIWYHSEPSYVPYSPNQFLGWDFFCRFLQQTGSRKTQKLQSRCPHYYARKI